LDITKSKLVMQVYDKHLRHGKVGVGFTEFQDKVYVQLPRVRCYGSVLGSGSGSGLGLGLGSGLGLPRT